VAEQGRFDLDAVRQDHAGVRRNQWCAPSPDVNCLARRRPAPPARSRMKKTRGSRPGDGSPRLLWCVAKCIGILPDGGLSAVSRQEGFPGSILVPDPSGARPSLLSGRAAAPRIPISCDIQYRFNDPGAIF
jgi:hypothetical protein